MLGKTPQITDLPHGAKIVDYYKGSVYIHSDHGTHIELTRRQWLDIVDYVIERGQKPHD
jgi:hypothetical protein